MDHAVSYCPGQQQHRCFHCHQDFLVLIDDQYRVFVYRDEGAPAQSRHGLFLAQLGQQLAKDRWQMLPNIPKDLDLVAHKDMGFGSSIYFLGIVAGDRYEDSREVRATLECLFDLIDQQTDSSDILHAFSGLLLLTFPDARQTAVDDKSRELACQSLLKRIYTTVGVFDFTTEIYFDPKPAPGKEWTPLIRPLLGQLDLRECKTAA
jgi:hypothetical protein